MGNSNRCLPVEAAVALSVFFCRLAQHGARGCCEEHYYVYVYALSTMVQGVVIEEGCIIDTNPATGEIIERVKTSTPEEVDAAVEAAKAAQPAWAALSLEARVNAVKAAVKLLEQDQAGLARLVTMEMCRVCGSTPGPH